MMPEHAVKALSELDGKIFQGRLLHLLPGRAQKSKVNRDGESGIHLLPKATNELGPSLLGSNDVKCLYLWSWSIQLLRRPNLTPLWVN